MPAVEAAIAQDTAGSPVDESLRWTNRSVPALAADQDQGFEIGVDALRRIPLEELGLSRRAAFKDEAACHFPQRDEQFEYIAKLRARYEREGWPILSIDTKKKEILGNFFHPGRALTDGRVIVQDHDFDSASQRLVPYGVFDVQRNEGLMLLATGSDTCELACDAIRRWWRRLGRRRYWFAPRMLVLSYCGGSNGNRQQRFKEELCYLATDLAFTDPGPVITQAVGNVISIVGTLREGAPVDGLGTGVSTEFYAYDGNQIILRLDEFGQVQNHYLWGAAVDQHLADEALTYPAEGNPTSNTRWALLDHQNSVRDLVDFDETDGSVDAIDHVIYQAFGQRADDGYWLQSNPRGCPSGCRCGGPASAGPSHSPGVK